MTGHAVSTETKCSRNNKDVEATLATPMRYHPMKSLKTCPANSMSSSAVCHGLGGPGYVPPPWALEGEKKAKADAVKCHSLA